jgi:hypothetical protein
MTTKHDNTNPDNTHPDNTNPVVRKTARIEDKATGQFLEEIEFRVSPEEVRRVQLLPSVVADLNKFEGSLIDRGARLPDDTQARKALLAEVAKSEAPDYYVYETRSGWLDPPILSASALPMPPATPAAVGRAAVIRRRGATRSGRFPVSVRCSYLRPARRWLRLCWR